MQTTWTKEFQSTHYKLPVYPAVSNYRLKKDLKKGQTVKRTYARQLVAKTTSGAGEFTRQTIVNAEETLQVNYEKDASFYVKDLDELQDHLPTQQQYARNASVALHQQIDADVLGQYSQFNEALDASYFGGVSGNGIELTSANVPQLFSGVNLQLQRANIHINVAVKFTAVKQEDSKFDIGLAVISPDVYAKIVERLEGKTSALGDTTGVQGHVGKYMGYDLIVSNALAWTGVLYMPTNPTDGDTIVINGVTITFKDTLTAASGSAEVHIAGSVDATRANLATFLTAGGATSEAEAANTGYSSVSSTPDASGFSDQDRLANITATDSASADTVSFVALGKGFVPVSETFASANNIWNTGTQIQHCLIGIHNAIDVVIQQEPKMDMRKRDSHIGSDVVTWCAYGIKVFNDGKPKMVDVKISTEDYVA